MATYSSYAELHGRTLAYDDRVIFTVKGESLVYSVRNSWLNHDSGINSEIFTKLGLSKESFCEKAYNYVPIGGDWPYSKDSDYEAATRLVLALFSHIEGRTTGYSFVGFGLASSAGCITSLSYSTPPTLPSLTPIKPPSLMSNLLAKFSSLYTSPEEKLLTKYGIESPIGTPTSQGLDLLLAILYKTHRADVIAKVKEIAAEDDKEKE